MVGLLKTDPPGSRNPGRREPAQNVLVSSRPHRLEENRHWLDPVADLWRESLRRRAARPSLWPDMKLERLIAAAPRSQGSRMKACDPMLGADFGELAAPEPCLAGQKTRPQSRPKTCR